jgi:hypothetical protein
MSVLNTASDGYPNVLVVLYRALVAYGPMSRDRLLGLCSFPGTESERPGQTLTRWMQLGLFRLDDEEVSIADIGWSPVAKPGELATATAALPATARRVLFLEANNERFWDADKSRSADLSRGLSWLLAQDIYDVVLDGNELKKLETTQIADQMRCIVQNDVRLNGLLAWARYLGFLSTVDAPIIDPTEALRQDLPALLGDAREMTAIGFLERLALMLPVLDGGGYRRQVEELLLPATWRRPSDGMLSTALSRALWRLQAANLLLLESRSDAIDSFALQRRGGYEWMRFTHVLPGGALR